MRLRQQSECNDDLQIDQVKEINRLSIDFSAVVEEKRLISTTLSYWTGLICLGPEGCKPRIKTTYHKLRIRFLPLSTLSS
ncbi:hypothetical protein PsorP6_005395 [Peronosclerospora sorghi]|uniref:Uncharacterized protein n=1 Tax=Peronosclerospora sorghi TaxID=230839 RepID=A0ACC0W471_9STRA|nr:hypothetical protein PsorP6_005395 [Peronosclerospora sorghi]